MNITEISIKEYEAIKVASIRYQGKYADCGKYFGKIFKCAMSKLDKKPLMLLCYDETYREEGADCEACVPVKVDFETDGVATRDLEAIKAVSCIYTGRYDNLHKVYAILMEYADTKGYERRIPGREVYIKGPGMIFKGNPEKYITEVILPIKVLEG